MAAKRFPHRSHVSAVAMTANHSNMRMGFCVDKTNGLSLIHSHASAHTHVLLGVPLVHSHVLIVSLVHAHTTHILLLLHHWLCIIRHSSDCHCFGMISSLDNKSSCRHASPEKLDRLIKMAVWTLEKVKINFSMSYRFCAKNVFVSDFDVKLVLHATAFNLHVFVHSPSWVSPAINTDSGSPFLKISNTHKNERVHLVHHSSSIVSQVALDGVDSQMTAVPVNHCSLHRHANHILLLHSHAHVLRWVSLVHAHVWLSHAHVLLGVTLIHTHVLLSHAHVLLGISLVHTHAWVAHTTHILLHAHTTHVLLLNWLCIVRHSSHSHSFGMISGLDNKSSCRHASPEKLDRFIKMAVWTFKEVKINLSMSNSLCAKDIFVPDFNVKLVLHTTAFNLHVLVHSPSWVSPAINTDSGSPFLKISNTHKNERVHLVHHSSSIVSQVALDWVDS